MRKKIEEGTVPITKENLPQFLKSKLDNISNDLETIFEDKTTNVRISQTNVYTRVIFQFRGPIDHRFENLKQLYSQLTKKEIQSD